MLRTSARIEPRRDEYNNANGRGRWCYSSQCYTLNVVQTGCVMQDAQTDKSRPFICIVHPGAEADVALARTIAAELTDIADAEILSFDELKVRFPLNVIYGITILILSGSVANDPARCAEAARLFKNVYTHSIFRHFVVARDVGVPKLRERPELNHFFENVMVREASHVGEIEAEIRAFAAKGWPSLADIGGFQRKALTTLFGGLFSLVLVVLNFLSRLSLVGAALLAATWYGGWHFEWAQPIAAACAYFAGYQLNFLQPFELWSWFGSRWKLPRGVATGTRRLTAISAMVPWGGLVFWGGTIVTAIALAISDQNLAMIAFGVGVVAQIAIDQVALRMGLPNENIAAAAAHALQAIPPARQSPSQLDLALVNRSATLAHIASYGGLLSVIFAVALRTAPAILSIGSDINALGIWIVAPLIAGFLTPTLLSPARLSLPAFAAAKGMTEEQNARIRAAMRVKQGTAVPPPLPQDAAAIQSFPPEERADVMRWLEALRMGRRAPFRPWFTRPDYAFISYAWAGEAKSRIAERVAAACAPAGIDCFVDTKGVESSSGAFRVYLGSGLTRATHVLLVVTPELLSGTVVLREVETAMQRWPLERMPAIICIVEPEIAEAIRANPAAPVTLRILLSFCPHLSFDEATQPAILQYILAWTHRPGKWRDWLFLISPATALARAVSLDGVVPDTVTPHETEPAKG